VTPATPLTRGEFDRLVGDQDALVRSVNDLELSLYQLGDPADECVAGCRNAAADVIARLRDLLFRWDQSVLPLVEPHPASSPSQATRGEAAVRDFLGTED
jgi:hypothetical protein